MTHIYKHIKIKFRCKFAWNTPVFCKHCSVIVILPFDILNRYLSLFVWLTIDSCAAVARAHLFTDDLRIGFCDANAMAIESHVLLNRIHIHWTLPLPLLLSLIIINVILMQNLTGWRLDNDSLHLLQFDCVIFRVFLSLFSSLTLFIQNQVANAAFRFICIYLEMLSFAMCNVVQFMSQWL